jgi:hypothetical protein
MNSDGIHHAAFAAGHSCAAGQSWLMHKVLPAKQCIHNCIAADRNRQVVVEAIRPITRRAPSLCRCWCTLKSAARANPLPDAAETRVSWQLTWICWANCCPKGRLLQTLLQPPASQKQQGQSACGSYDLCCKIIRPTLPPEGILNSGSLCLHACHANLCSSPSTGAQRCLGRCHQICNGLTCCSCSSSMWCNITSTCCCCCGCTGFGADVVLRNANGIAALGPMWAAAGCGGAVAAAPVADAKPARCCHDKAASG